MPQGYLAPFVPRAIRSHSGSVGSRLPSQVQNCAASYAVTHTTGTVPVAPGEIRVVGGLVRLGAPEGLDAVPVLLVGDLVDVHPERREDFPPVVRTHEGRAAGQRDRGTERLGLVPQPRVPDRGLGQPCDPGQGGSDHRREAEPDRQQPQ